MTETSPQATPRPQDDLFRHVNAEWLAQTTIPADRAVFGAFSQLRDASEEQCRDIIEQCVSSATEGEELLIARLYSEFMDADAIEAAGISGLACDLDLVRNAQTKGDLARVAGILDRRSIGGWVAPYVGTDPEHPTDYCPSLAPSGLSLPDEVYYFGEEYTAVRQAFIRHVERMFALAGFDSPAAAAATVFDVERGFARFHLDSVRSRDVDLTVNLTTFDEAADAAPGFAWHTWAQALGANFGRINVDWPAFLTGGARWWSTLPIADLKTWMTWRVLTRYAAYLPAAFVDENFDFFSRTLAGTSELRARWKRGVGVVEGHLGFALGRLYVAQHFPASSRDAMRTLVDNLLAAYRDSIGALTWMSETTRDAALTKLGMFTPKIGYPENARTYEDVHFGADDTLLDLVRVSSEAASDYELAKLGQKVDPDEWHMTPQTVNAYYNPLANEIVFPAAILQPPFFSPDATLEQNYGGIGAVIGHEIGHGFDDQGSRFDGTGALKNWWQDADFEEFSARTKALIAQYDAYYPAQLDGKTHVNGALTIGENIGDLGGLSIALKALYLARAQADAGEPDEADIREFFFQWARIWREKIRNEILVQLITVDPHSPAEFRCNGVVRNMDAFHEAFATTPEDALWLDPDQRVSIW
ncbi:MAG: M13-type metalloendopeptidase [Actinomycetaceae bacterium]|nr:M13-type metalloendopeptidase [Actinomycetaceae bacterium]MDU0970295.1 M13-type metalloendopeptidase [Actinomycetaceae bacterium]